MATTFRKNLVQVPVAQGMDAGIDPKVSERPILLENAVHDLRGMIKKRQGQNQSVENTVTNNPWPRRIADYNGAILGYGSVGLSYYSPLSDVWRVGTGSDREAVLDFLPSHLLASSAEVLAVDAVESGGILAVALTVLVGANVQTEVRSYDSSTLIQIDRVAIGSGASPNRRIFGRVLNTGSGLMYYGIGASGDFQRATISSTGDITSTGNMGIDAVSGGANGHTWDVCNINANDVALVHIPSGGTIVRYTVLTNGTETGKTDTTVFTIADAKTEDIVACYQLANNEVVVIWFEFSGATVNCRAESYDQNGSVVEAVATVDSWTNTAFGRSGRGTPESVVGIGSNYSTADDGGVIYITGLDLTNASAGTNDPYAVREVELDKNAGMAGTFLKEYPRTRAVGRPTLLDGITWSEGNDTTIPTGWTLPIYMEMWPVTTGSDTATTQRMFYWASRGGSDLRLCGKAAPGKAYPLSYNPCSATNDKWFLPSILRLAGEVPLSSGFDPPAEDWSVTQYTMDQVPVVPTHDDDGTVIVGGSLPRIYDGRDFHEFGYSMYPDQLIADDFGSGSGPGAGTYNYKATWEHLDNNGRRVQSIPSVIPASVVMATSNLVRVRVPTHPWATTTVANVILWRTVDNGTVYHRTATKTQDTTVSELVFTDGTSDTDLVTNEILYTTGGVLGAQSPTSYVASAIWQNRHVVVDRETGNIRYSRQKVPNEVYLHSDFLELQVDKLGGQARALAVMSDKLVIFKANRILVTEGEGLNDIGGGVNFLRPYVVSDSVGCKDPDSVVRTPLGLMFRADDSIWLLDRSFQLVRIGEPVRYFTNMNGNDANTCIGAFMDNVAGRVIFGFNNSAAALVFDINRKVWSQFTNFTGTHLINAAGNYYRLDPNVSAQGIIWSEDSTNFDDNATYVPMRVRTGWISKGDVGGWYRVEEIVLVMENVDNHTLNVKIAYNGEPHFIDELTRAPLPAGEFNFSNYYGTMDNTLSVDRAYVLKIQPSRPKCTSFMLEIADSISIGNTEGFNLSAVLLAVKQKFDTAHVDVGRFLES